MSASDRRPAGRIPEALLRHVETNFTREQMAAAYGCDQETISRWGRKWAASQTDPLRGARHLDAGKPGRTPPAAGPEGPRGAQPRHASDREDSLMAGVTGRKIRRRRLAYLVHGRHRKAAIRQGHPFQAGVSPAGKGA